MTKLNKTQKKQLKQNLRNLLLEIKNKLNIKTYYKYLDDINEKQRTDTLNKLKNIFEKIKNSNIYNLNLLKIKDLMTKKINIDYLEKSKLNLGTVKNHLRENYINKSIYIEYIGPNEENNEIINYFREFVNIPTINNFNRWWKNEGKYIFFSNPSTGETYFEKYDYKGKLFFYPEIIDNNPNYLIQNFKEGIKNCLLNPIYEWCIYKINNLTENSSERTIDRYEKIREKIEEYINIYKNGVPENELQNICNELQININITSPFNKDKIYFNFESTKKALKKFNYINTKFDHVDLNEILNKDIIELENEEFDNKLKELNENNIFYTWKMNNNKISKIFTFENTYERINEYKKVFKLFEELTGLNECKIDDIDDKYLSKYVRNSVHVNGCVDFKETKSLRKNIGKYLDEGIEEDEDEIYIKKPNHYNNEIIRRNEEISLDKIKHIDQKKAYTNYHLSEYYEGFLGKITDWRKTTKIEGIGLYRITHIDFSEANEQLKNYNDKMSIYHNGNIYPSFEIKFLLDNNVKLDIIEGCWGSKIDINLYKPKNIQKNIFNKMLNDKVDNEIAYYAMYAGMTNSSLSLNDNFYMRTTLNHYNIMKNQMGEDIKLYSNDICKVSYKKEHNHHLSQYLSFITGYQRIQVLEQLMVMNINNIIRVCVDGIYYINEENLILKNCFREKNDKMTFENIACESYISNIQKYYSINMNEYRKHYKTQLCYGPGGSGKTHYNIVDNGLIRKLFIAPSWKLARNKKEEYNCDVSVWARVITNDPEVYNKIKRKYNVLIFDEVSMMSNQDKKFILENYKNCKLIFCGDIGYQLPCIGNKIIEIEDKDGKIIKQTIKLEEFKKEDFDNYLEFNTDYRSNDENLNKIKKYLRESIYKKRKYTEIKEYLLENIKLISKEYLLEKYDINDMILTHKNECKDEYTELLKNKFDKINKYYVKRNNLLYSNGDIIIGEKPEASCEIRHCFTVHCIQGETARYNLYINITDIKDIKMLYTAVSRAKRLDQIYLIN